MVQNSVHHSSISSVGMQELLVNIQSDIHHRKMVSRENKPDISRERARYMLSNDGLENKFWPQAVITACYLINLGPYSGIECRILNEVWLGRSADYSILRVFDCIAQLIIMLMKENWNQEKRRECL